MTLSFSLSSLSSYIQNDSTTFIYIRISPIFKTQQHLLDMTITMTNNNNESICMRMYVCIVCMFVRAGWLAGWIIFVSFTADIDRV